MNLKHVRLDRNALYIHIAEVHIALAWNSQCSWDYFVSDGIYGSRVFREVYLFWFTILFMIL